MSSAGGDGGHDGCRDARHLRPKFLIVIQKYKMENISRAKGGAIERNERIMEETGGTQKTIVKLRYNLWSDPSQVTNDI
jgi:protein tyrosine phosphatase